MKRLLLSRMSKWKCRVIATTLFFHLSSATASEAENLFSLSLQELSQVTVTIASLTEETFTDAPSSVTVITRQEIEQLGVRTLTELLNYVPGFQSYMSPHESNAGMILARGLSKSYGEHILFMIDGHRINDEYTAGLTYANHLMSLYNVKQVEFIRGPGSALYGSNAFSGAINIITEKRKHTSVTVGSNNARGVSASTFDSIGEFETSAAFNYYRDDGQSYSGLTDANGFNKSTQDPVEVFESRVDVTYQRSRLIMEYMNTQLDDYYAFRRIKNGINQNNSSRLGIYLENDFNMPQNWTGSGRIGFMRSERYMETLLSPADPEELSSDLQQDTRDAQADFTYATSTDHQLSFGTYLGYMDIPKAVGDSDNTERFVLDKSRRIVGLYIQDQFDLREDLRLTAGLRYDNYSDFGDTTNPRLALLYRWREHDSFKLMYGQAYRAPSMGDLYDKESTDNVGNLSLKPVVVNTYELAYLHSKENNNFILTWFYNDYRDFTTLTTQSGNVVVDNIYDNQTQGLELDFRWQLADRWGTRIGLTHILSSSTNAPAGVTFSKPEDLAPKTYGNVQLNYQHDKWNGNINVVAHDSIAVMQSQNAVAVVNSKLIYQFKKQWRLGANIRNLLDDNYSTPTTRTIGQDQSGQNVQELPSREREFFISLSYSR